MVAELQVAVDEADLAAELAVQRDRRVDRDRRRAHAALRTVEGVHAPERRPREHQLLGREAGEQALDPREQLRRVERLDQVVVCAGAHAADLLLHLAFAVSMMIGMWLPLGLLGPDLLGDLVAVELGEHDVEQDHVRQLGAPQPESLGTVDRADDLVALLLQRVLQQSLDIGIVIDHEDLGGHQSSPAFKRGDSVRRRASSPAAPRL
jgi:hypothetical protein